MGSLNCCDMNRNRKEEKKTELSSERGQNIPQLICFYESGNEEQKEYCNKLKKNYNYEKPIDWDIKSIPKVPFGIKIAYNSKIEDLQNEFDDSEDTMFETLRKAYQFLEKI